MKKHSLSGFAWNGAGLAFILAFAIDLESTLTPPNPDTSTGNPNDPESSHS